MESIVEIINLIKFHGETNILMLFNALIIATHLMKFYADKL